MKRPKTALPLPVKTVLGNVLDETAVQRAFRTIEARRRPVAKAFPRRSMVLGALAACFALAMFIWMRPRDAGPLMLASGDVLGVVDATNTAVDVQLTDKSRIELALGSRLVPLENKGQSVLLLLERGRAHFEVEPGGPRQWRIECGLASVEVVGTGFTIQREVDRLHVDVQHGVVLVRGDTIENRVQKLTAGQSLEIVSPAGGSVGITTAVPQDATTAQALSPTTTAQAPPLASTQNASPPPNWRDLAKRGAYVAAYDLLGERSIRAETRTATVSLVDLFLMADVARLSGHVDQAVALLNTIVSVHAKNPQASLAAFTLGKLQMGTNPKVAATMFQRSLEMGLPATLRGDAVSHWMASCERIADDPSCKTRATTFRSGSDAPPTMSADSPMKESPKKAIELE